MTSKRPSNRFKNSRSKDQERSNFGDIKHERGKASPKAFKVKWESLDKIIKNIKRRRSLRNKQSNSKRELSKKEILGIVPMPSYGKESRKSRRSALLPKMRLAVSKKSKLSQKSREKRHWQKNAANKYKAGDEDSKLIAELNKIKPGSLDMETPFPSSKVPTFIEMVKTAIRDLSKFDMTRRKTIARYIELRYKVRNDDLLKFALKWMLKMKILKRSEGLYYLSKKRGATKNKSKKGRKTNKKSKSKSKKKQKKRSQKKKKKPKSKETKKSKKKNKCTCAKDMKKRKNLVKMKTRYVRRNGKIYKEDVYV